MGEVRFMISEAAKQVDVESHVLRYWEEELGLTIGRTEMGHRYYTKDDIQLFRCIITHAFTISIILYLYIICRHFLIFPGILQKILILI